jgi:hypothetical protein
VLPQGRVLPPCPSSLWQQMKVLMTPQIIEKIQAELRAGIKTESQVVYVLAEIRKIIEREGSSARYEYLEFHCNWVLHSRLGGKFAQHVLRQFDSGHLKLVKGEHFSASYEVEKISKMDGFREELSAFLKAHSITDISKSSDTWSKFLFLYAQVIEDVPLLIWADSSAATREVVISVESATREAEGHRFYKVIWKVTYKDGRSESVFVINSFEIPK